MRKMVVQGAGGVLASYWEQVKGWMGTL